MKYILASLFATAMATASFAQSNNNNGFIDTSYTGNTSKLNTNSERFSGDDLYYPEGYDPAQQSKTDLNVSDGKANNNSDPKASKTNKNVKSNKSGAKLKKVNKQNSAAMGESDDEYRKNKEQSNLSSQAKSSDNKMLERGDYKNYKFNNTSSDEYKGQDGSAREKINVDTYRGDKF